MLLFSIKENRYWTINESSLYVVVGVTCYTPSHRLVLACVRESMCVCIINVRWMSVKCTLGSLKQKWILPGWRRAPNTTPNRPPIHFNSHLYTHRYIHIHSHLYEKKSDLFVYRLKVCRIAIAGQRKGFSSSSDLSCSEILVFLRLFCWWWGLQQHFICP